MNLAKTQPQNDKATPSETQLQIDYRTKFATHNDDIFNNYQYKERHISRSRIKRRLHTCNDRYQDGFCKLKLYPNK
jgi:hypothetical protein